MTRSDGCQHDSHVFDLRRTAEDRRRHEVVDLGVGQHETLLVGCNCQAAEKVLVLARFGVDLNNQFITRMRWLAPGGWLLLEDATDFAMHSSPDPSYRRMSAAINRVCPEDIGMDFDWARSFPHHLAAAASTAWASTPRYQ